MITYINEKNASQYEVLFSKATDILTKTGVLVPESDEEYVKYNSNGYVHRERFEKNPGDFFVKTGDEDNPFRACTSMEDFNIETDYYVRNLPEITTLEKYYSVLKDLLRLDQGNNPTEIYEITHSQGRRFTMLPLDGDVFEVNANTRAITVPESFRKNGLAVQGDELAEVVYFKIDRFFDATDLDSCDCYIQWEAPTGQVGVSYPWVVDIESEPNKMIIGWALSKQISSEPGNVRFALRFYKTNSDNELIFSFGTLTASAAVKSTLSVDMSKIGQEGGIMPEHATDQNIINRITTSTTKVTNVIPVAGPVFDNPTITKETYFDLDPNMVWSGEDMGAVQLQAMAHSTDSGIISYSWGKIGTKGDITPVEEIISVVEFSAAHPGWTVEQAKNSDIAFYVKGDGTPSNWTRYIFTENTTDEDLKNLVEIRSAAKVGVVGTYNVVATNRKGFSTKSNVSPSYIVPQPVPFAVDDQYDDAVTLTTDTILAVEVSQKDKAQPDAAEGTGNAVLSYAWKRNGEIIEGANESTYKPTEAGWYQAIITNTRNEAIVTTAEPPANKEDIREIDQYIDPLYSAYVAPAATQPQLSYPVEGDFNAKAPGSSVDDAIQVYANQLTEEPANAYLDMLRVDVDYENWGINEFICGDAEGPATESGKKGSLTYQWYQVKNIPDKGAPAVGAEADILIAGATGNRFVPESGFETGVFYCKITNTLINGTSAVTYSPLFLIVDTN